MTRFFIIAFVLLASCKSAISHFKNTVYTFQPGYNFDECYVESACDCCAFDLVLLESNFYLISYCIGDTDYSKGSFEVNKNQITLNLTEIRISKLHNIQSEFTDTIPAYKYKQSLVDPKTIIISIEQCDEEPYLKLDDYYGSKKLEKPSDILPALQKDGILDRLN
jgi:hypothetical protein